MKKKELKLSDLDGIGPESVKKLENNKIFDVMGLAVLSPSSLSDISGLGPSVARKAIQQAQDLLELNFTKGTAYEKKRGDMITITTGSLELDDLLGGKGIESRAITELFAKFGSGKTQLALQLAVNVQLPKSKGGANGKVMYIDSEGTFRFDRIKQMAEALELEPKKVLDNIFIARAFNSDHQMLLLNKINEMIQSGQNIKLIVIDSLTSHFRAEYTGRKQLADRQQKLNIHLHELMKLAEQNNLAILITNQVMDDPSNPYGDPIKAIGGNIVAHASTFRLYLRRGKSVNPESRIVKLIDSPNLPDDERMMYVTKYGIRDMDGIKIDKLKQETQQKL